MILVLVGIYSKATMKDSRKTLLLIRKCEGNIFGFRMSSAWMNGQEKRGVVSGHWIFRQRCHDCSIETQGCVVLSTMKWGNTHEANCMCIRKHSTQAEQRRQRSLFPRFLGSHLGRDDPNTPKRCNQTKIMLFIQTS
jgi:hypothetical protein